MPTYDYIDQNGHIKEVSHRMMYTTSVLCEVCGLEMWRKPAGGIGVIWGGLPPSQEQRDPAIEQHLAQDFGRARAENDEKYSK